MSRLLAVTLSSIVVLVGSVPALAVDFSRAEEVVRQAQADAGGIRAQAEALFRLAWAGSENSATIEGARTWGLPIHSEVPSITDGAPLIVAQPRRGASSSWCRLSVVSTAIGALLRRANLRI